MLFSESPSDTPTVVPQPKLLEGVVTLRQVSAGAYGVVYLGRDAGGRLLAIKEVRDSSGTKDRERHGMECYLENFPNGSSHLLCIYQISPVDARPLCYSMEVADNLNDQNGYDSYETKSVQSVINRYGLPRQTKLIQWMHELLDGVEELHKKGLIHRDIKPSNLFFVHGDLKIGDFSLVTASCSDATLIGTKGYLPEGRLFASEETDLYAVGKVLYTLITGRPERDFPEIPRKLMSDAGVRELNRFLVERACSNDSEARFHSVAAFREAFDDICVPVARARKRQRIRRQVFIGAQLLFVVAIILQLIYLSNRLHNTKGNSIPAGYSIDSEEWYEQYSPPSEEMSFQFGDQDGLKMAVDSESLVWQRDDAMVKNSDFEVFFEMDCVPRDGLVSVRFADESGQEFLSLSCVITPKGIFDESNAIRGAPSGPSLRGIRVQHWDGKLMLLDNGQLRKAIPMPPQDFPWRISFELQCEKPTSARLQRICCFGNW